MRRVGLLATAVALVALACGVVTLQPEPIAPMNLCTDDPSCVTTFPEAGAGACVGASCSTTTFAPSGAASSPFLVIAMPQGQIVGGSITIPVPQNYGLVRGQLVQNGILPTTASCLNAQQGAPVTECDPVPPVASFFAGKLQVASGFDSVLVPPNGLRPNNPNNSPSLNSTTAVPVDMIAEMLWQDPATGKYAPARKLGIALDDVLGTLTTDQNLFGPTNGKSTVPGFQYAVSVPQPLSPNDPMNAYRFYLTPPNPYGSIPPLLIQESAPSQDLAGVSESLSEQSSALEYDTPSLDGGAIQAHPYQIIEAPGAPSLAGWTLHIDDQNGHRVSGNVVLSAGASKTVTVYEATSNAAQADPLPGPDRYVETLYIDPPPGTSLPRYFSPAQGKSIVGPFTYPMLPPTVSRSGYVRASDTLETTTAQILFVANGNNDAILEADLTTPASFLLQSWPTTTTSGGQWVIADVYPGTLRAYVVPDDPNLALTASDQQIGPSGGPGATLFVNPRTHVKGRVVLPNGMPVFAADVIIAASADSPFLANDDPLARPREVRGTTDTNGLFDVPSDPGFVDISIRPRDTTNFPWVVLTNRVVPPNDGTSDAGAQVTLGISDVVIPEPSRFTQAASGVLTDSVGNPIVHAVVRAYAFPQLATGVDGGAPQTRGARLLGMTVTDDSAQFQLFVVPPQ